MNDGRSDFTRVFARYEYSRGCGMRSCQRPRVPGRLLCLNHALEADDLLREFLARPARNIKGATK